MSDNNVLTSLFGVPAIADQENNNRRGECGDYIEKLTAKQLQLMRDQRQTYHDVYISIDKQLQAIATNKRIKTKKAEYCLLGKRYKSYFNYRSLDYYLYMLGIVPKDPATSKFGIEFELAELFKVTMSLLLVIDNYDGYLFTHWKYGSGHADYLVAGAPDEDEQFKRADLGVVFV